MISRLLRMSERCSAGGVLPPPANEVSGGEGWGGGWCLGHRCRPTNRPPPPTPPHHSLREWEEGRRPRRWRCFIFASVVVAAFANAALAQDASPQPKVTIGFVDIAGDPRHE